MLNFLNSIYENIKSETTIACGDVICVGQNLFSYSFVGFILEVNIDMYRSYMCNRYKCKPSITVVTNESPVF